jgi:glycosyltransferase involved in cell wall biosynthesis
LFQLIPQVAGALDESGNSASPTRLTVLVANPSADVYGSDLQLLDSVSGMVGQGWRVVVAIPEPGRLVQMLTGRGAEVEFVDFPVVRRANLSAKGMAALVAATPKALVTMRRMLNRIRPDVLYVNTMTLPWWLLAGRLARVPTLCHVHEAEDNDRRLILTALTVPLFLSNSVVANSRASIETISKFVPRLMGRISLIYNGIAPPPGEPALAGRTGAPFRVVVVCRLSPRKAPDVALEAVGLLRSQGREVEIDICGTAFAGYEWFVQHLEERARRADLAGAVTFSGYVSPIWSALERADVVVAPSLREPFGNAVVEAQLARRPVVASAALGHLETVIDGETGLLVSAGDAAELAAAVARLIDDPVLAARLADQGQARARKHFSIGRYHLEMVQLITSLSRRRI